MKRQLAICFALCGAIAAAGCAGGTEPATNVLNVSAQLNAKGYTNDGPATWWWEYDTVKADLGTASDTEVCGNGTGPREPDNRCGPAAAGSASNQIPLNVVVNGLTPNTTYYFRACGQDTNDPGPTCANTRSFKTLAGTAYTVDRSIGGDGGPPSGLHYPEGLVIDPVGNAYVASSFNDRVVKFGPTGAFVGTFGRTRGDGEGALEQPVDVDRDSSGNFYVTSYFGKSMSKFSSTGQFLTKWTLPTVANGIAVDQAGNVFISFQDEYLVRKYSPTGSVITAWGTQGDGDGQFNPPSGMDVDAAGNVYVADIFNHRVQKFTSSGTFLGKFGTFGFGNGQMYQPNDVAVDAQGNLYTAEMAIRVQKLSPSGAFIATLQAEGPTNVFYPTYVTTDEFGNVYASDLHNTRVVKFKPSQ